MRIRGLLRELVDAPEPLLILAHTASGTSWLNHVLQDAGRPIHHEHVNPHRRGPGRDLLTWKLTKAELEGRSHHPEGLAEPIVFEAVWHMVRDPLPHVFSAAALFRKDPDHAERLCQVLGMKPSKGSWLKTAMRTVPAFHKRAEKVRDRVFHVERVEFDIPRENNHHAGPATWDQLEATDKRLANGIRKLREELGYGGDDG